MIRSEDPNFSYEILNEGRAFCSLNSYVASEILEIVQRLDYVPLKILKAWLPTGVSEETIVMHLHALEAAQKIAYHRALNIVCGKYYLRNELSAADKIQNELIVPAASVLCEFKKNSALRYYTRLSYPSQIFLITTDGFAADVTTLTPEFSKNSDPFRTILPKYWAANIPEGETDNIFHIAVVPGNEKWNGFQKFLAAVQKIGFQAYATCDPETLEATIRNF